jgi:hypothetical protein
MLLGLRILFMLHCSYVRCSVETCLVHELMIAIHVMDFFGKVRRPLRSSSSNASRPLMAQPKHTLPFNSQLDGKKRVRERDEEREREKHVKGEGYT